MLAKRYHNLRSGACRETGVLLTLPTIQSSEGFATFNILLE